MPNMRTDLPFSTDIAAHDATEPNHATVFNQRGNQFASNDTYLKDELDTIKEKIQAGLPANGGNSDTVDNCHAGTAAGNVLKLDNRGKVIEGALSQAVKKWWKPGQSYALGEAVEALDFNKPFYYICTQAGTTNLTAPTWSVVDGEEFMDGTVKWQAVDKRDAATIDGHLAGISAGNVLVLDAAAKVPLANLSIVEIGKIKETNLNAAAKKWWKASVNYSVGDVIQPLAATKGQFYLCTQSGTTGATEPAWLSENGSEFADGTARWKTTAFNSLGGSVGDIRFPAMTVKPGEIKLNGALLLRASYPALWAWAQSNSLVATEVGWAGTWGGCFSEGDGSTTFRLPDLRGQFLRVLDDGRGLDDFAGRKTGQSQGDAIRNITGDFYSQGMESNVMGGTGAFTAGNGGAKGSGSSGNGARFWFNAGNVVPIAAENRPKNIAYFACIRFE